MARIIDVLPEATGDEMMFLQNLIKDMSDEKARSFATAYRARRRDPMLILVLALLGFAGIAGIHRFITDQIGMGILYILTLGLCWIGTIIDAVNYKKLAFEYNSKVANEVLVMVQ